jgi:hypothetical protein
MVQYPKSEQDDTDAEPDAVLTLGGKSFVVAPEGQVSARGNVGGRPLVIAEVDLSRCVNSTDPPAFESVSRPRQQVLGPSKVRLRVEDQTVSPRRWSDTQFIWNLPANISSVADSNQPDDALGKHW